MFIIFIGLLLMLSLLLLLHLFRKHLYTAEMVMGGRFYQQFSKNEKSQKISEKIIDEKYFRPSKSPILNDRDFLSGIFNAYAGKEPSEITLPDYLLKTPEDTIINYFSILKQAANPPEGIRTGCGTIGYAKRPYPVAYNFLSSVFQKKMNYNQYLKSFENILHINLIKLKEISIESRIWNSMVKIICVPPIMDGITWRR